MAESPVAVRAHLDEPLSRWLWLVKWLLAIPDFVAAREGRPRSSPAGRTTTGSRA